VLAAIVIVQWEDAVDKKVLASGRRKPRCLAGDRFVIGDYEERGRHTALLPNRLPCFVTIHFLQTSHRGL
jgi:hypothetical protein